MDINPDRTLTQAEPGAYSISPEFLFEEARRLKETYIHAEPFPHIVIDQLFPESVLSGILSEFPQPDQIQWTKFDNANEKKLGSRNEMQLGNRARLLIWELNSQVFISFLEMLTGITGLVPDPHLMGGGLHQIVKGGLLKVHADFNHHAKLNLERRINLLLYLNRDWREEYGGHLELWNRDMTKCVKKVLPVFNRCVVFSTTDFAYHGHPEPLTCPEGWSRKSLAMYYYTNGRPADEATAGHSTLFQARPGEQVAAPSRESPSLLKSLVPPILVQLFRKVRGKPPSEA